MRQIRIIGCFLLLACLTLSAMAQQAQTVRGVVLDENASAVIGASVHIPGTTVGTTTDRDGKFILRNVPADQTTFQVNYLGYETQTVKITGPNEITVTLTPSNLEMEEVVVIGYGTQKRAHLTGAVATVTPAEIADLSATSLSATLEGMMPGVSVSQSSNRPGDAARISIRGESDILYIIDDVISNQTAFNNLDPNEIEQISVLKDAAAAVYGSRSASGAVLDRTKRGHVGKPKISYNGQLGFADEFYRSKMLDSYNYGLLWNGVRAADPTQTGFDNRRHLFQADELEAMKNINYDLLDKYWSSALTQKHGITLSGGSENLTAFGAISYQTQDGNMGRLEYERWNFRAGMDTKINRWLKASLTVSGDYGSSQKANNRIGGSSGEKDYSMLQTHPTYIPEYITDPATGETYPVAAFGISNSSVAGSTDNLTQLYHFDMIENSGDFIKNKPSNITINGSLEYDFGWSKILKGLKVRATYSKSISTTKTNEYGTTYRLYAFGDELHGRGGSGNHLYMNTSDQQLDFSSLRVVDANNGDYLRRSTSRSDSYQLNFYATYARTFGLHDISALFTIERSESESEDLFGRRGEPFSFTNYQYSGAEGQSETGFGRSEAASLSYVGRLNYVYDGKYLAELMIRTDASTKFAPENYWGTFPSLSLGWIISQESWFKRNVRFVDFLKIRGSFGLLGRDNISAWAWQQYYGQEAVKGPIFGSNPDQNSGPHFQIPDNVPNRNSHWDKSYQYNAGLDMNFLQNRLSANIDGYYRHNKEVFMQISNSAGFPTTVGANASASNYGENANWGMEFSLGWRDKIGKDASYWLKLNFGWSDDKLIKFPGMEDKKRALDAQMQNERSDRGRWGYECIGMFQNYQEIGEFFAENNLDTYMGKTQQDIHPGMLIYKNIRGSQKDDGTYYGVNDPNDPKGNVIDDNDRIRISDRSSNRYGFTLNFGGQWKSLTLSAQLGASWGSYTFMPSAALAPRDISGRSGWEVMEYINMPSFWAGNMFVYEDVLDASGRVVAPQNRNAKYPNMRFSENFVQSTFWKVNNANVFLRNLTIAYTLPKAWVNKLGIESCRINFTGQNLLELYNPYPDKFMSPNSSYNTYPLLRRFTVGLNITF